jgi:capsular exopolysaccharide synthesis family protein
VRSLMVTSTSPFEGKSTIASHFAIVNARNGNKTLLIDGDLRRPSIQHLLHLEGGKGLADVLSGKTQWRGALTHRQDIDNLDVLTAGSPSLRNPELIGPRLLELIEEAKKAYHLVILDSPPVQGFPEPLQMATAVDGVMVVAHAGRTSRKALTATVSSLTRLRAHVIGIVLNQVKANTSETGYYTYYQAKDYHRA